jgi:hypothetical protein
MDRQKWSESRRRSRDANDPQETSLSALGVPHCHRAHVLMWRDAVTCSWALLPLTGLTYSGVLMALEMVFWIVDDETIQKLRDAPHLLTDFLDNHEPAECTGPNHRNVDIFHFILNGTEDPVSGIKGIFEGLDAEYAIAIGEEATAISSESTRQLLKAFRKLDEAKIRKRWSQWIKRKELAEYEDEPGVSFTDLTQLCELAVDEKQGLLWTWG